MKTIDNSTNNTTKTIFSKSFLNRKTATEKQQAILSSKREDLKKLSKKLKKKKVKGDIQTINEGLIAIYAKEGHNDLKTFQEWNKQGFKVNKGEKSLLLWGRKKTTLKKTDDEDVESYKFHPICFVFSSKQVTAKATN